MALELSKQNGLHVIRRALAMLIAVLFWSVQTADAVVLHVNTSGASSVVLVDDGGKSDVQADSDGGAKKDTKGGLSGADGCQFHALHHVFFSAPEADAVLLIVSADYEYGHNTALTRVSSQLNRPPLV